MIRIIDDWYIEVESSPTNYTIRRGNGKRDAKGRCNDKVYGYYGTLQNAIKALRREIAADNLSDSFRTISEAFRTIQEIDARFETIMKSVTT